MKKLLLSSLALCLAFVSYSAQYTVDNKGNVIFEMTLENLPNDKAEIHASATDYLENAYKDTKYSIVENNLEKGVVTGQGEIVNFHESGGILKSNIYSITFFVRVDAKDGRARIRFVVHNYSLDTLSDIKSESKQELPVSECAPIGSVYKDKGHKKAFEKLQEIADKTLNLVADAIKSATPAIAQDEDW